MNLVTPSYFVYEPTHRNDYLLKLSGISRTITSVYSTEAYINDFLNKMLARNGQIQHFEFIF